MREPSSCELLATASPRLDNIPSKALKETFWSYDLASTCLFYQAFKAHDIVYFSIYSAKAEKT